MNENKNEAVRRSGVVIWAVALAISFLFFYGMDQAIMAMQGLPLGINMSPAK